ncbi:hypothetical protein [Streptomyces sp. NRRL WC-3742]|uniref:hypothetical protein n=1 Tax=Streptomyces sp. NRRL WC-3742 TaxID=1463934 RepID=UPI00131D617C|nr:hypothetical protein [Streptomyces sp. NRRL WC-3742]
MTLVSPPSPPSPPPDPRSDSLAFDYSGMRALVADLVPPPDVSGAVRSALETARELMVHSFYRYEFATVAVVHSLYGLERALVEGLGVEGLGVEELGEEEPLEGLIARALEAGLVTAELAGALDRGRRVRDQIASGAATSATLPAGGALGLLRSVFEAVALVLGPPEEAKKPTRVEQLQDRWDELRSRPFPPGFAGAEIAGVDLVMLDLNVAGLVHRALNGGLDDDHVAHLWRCIADLDTVVPLIGEGNCAAYFAQVRATAVLAVAPYVPPAF